MTGCIANVIKKTQHPYPSKSQHSHFHIAPYAPLKKGERQNSSKTDASRSLDATATTRIEKIFRSLLWCGHVIDYDILHTLSTISASQAKPNTTSNDHFNHLLDYCATYLHVILHYWASDIILVIDLDAAYFAPGARSRVAGYFHSNSVLLSPTNFNAAARIECKLLRYVVAYYTKAETTSVFAILNDLSPFATWLGNLDVHCQILH